MSFYVIKSVSSIITSAKVLINLLFFKKGIIVKLLINVDLSVVYWAAEIFVHLKTAVTGQKQKSHLNPVNLAKFKGKVLVI